MSYRIRYSRAFARDVEEITDYFRQKHAGEETLE